MRRNKPYEFIIVLTPQDIYQDYLKFSDKKFHIVLCTKVEPKDF